MSDHSTCGRDCCCLLSGLLELGNLSLVLPHLILELPVNPLSLVKHLIDFPKLPLFLTDDSLHLMLLLIDLALGAAVSEEHSEQLLNLGE